MKNARILLVVAGVLILVNVASLVLIWWAPQNKTGNPPKPESIEAFLNRELSLTPEQNKTYLALIREHRQVSRTLVEGNAKEMNALMQSIGAAKLDTLQMIAISQRMGQNESEKALNTAYHFRKFRDLLTAEQQTKFDKVIGDVVKMMAPGAPGRKPDKGNRPPGDFPDGPPPGDRPSGERPPGPRP